MDKMTEEQIKYMVERFLSWKLPENFQPDAGISFNPKFNEHTAHPMRHRPSGTNLFDYVQAKSMIEHLIEGMPLPSPPSAASKIPGEDDALRSALKAILPFVRYLDDAGPCHESWQSDELIKAIENADEALSHPYAGVDGKGPYKPRHPGAINKMDDDVLDRIYARKPKNIDQPAREAVDLEKLKKSALRKLTSSIGGASVLHDATRQARKTAIIDTIGYLATRNLIAQGQTPVDVIEGLETALVYFDKHGPERTSLDHMDKIAEAARLQLARQKGGV